MQVVPFPGPIPSREAEVDLGHMVEILTETAGLLEAARNSDDADVRTASIDLGVRALKAAVMAIARIDPAAGEPRRAAAQVLSGPWAAGTEPERL